MREDQKPILAESNQQSLSWYKINPITNNKEKFYLGQQRKFPIPGNNREKFLLLTTKKFNPGRAPNFCYVVNCLGYNDDRKEFKEPQSNLF